MIISPKNKFIFFKTMKMAGSSIELVLLEYCGPNALCPGSSLNMGSNVMEYEQRNNKDHLNRSKFHAHTWPSLFKSKIKNYAIFKDYKKVSITRNPWDQVVSFYWYDMSTIPLELHDVFLIKKNDSRKKAQKKFEKWFNRIGLYNSYIEDDLHHECTPSQYIGGINEKFIDKDIDYFIAFKDLQNSFNDIAKKIIIDYKETNLPRLKGNRRKLKKHYSWYYNIRTRKKVEKYFEKTIDRFNYKFEIK